MYGVPGQAYIYLIYGMHHLLNVVAWPEEQPASVLIRGLEPLEGLEGHTTHGPGRLTRAMGIDRSSNGNLLLPENGLWIERENPSSRWDCHWAQDWCRLCG